ncbi:MAG: hypothetical protein ACP5RX_02870 [Minisyncoccia bacterium]
MKIVIDDLINLIENLKKKINTYENDFSKSEALVRYALIDPFLRVLGWDTEDPSQIRPEYSTQAGRPDYALILREKPMAFLGAKGLGKSEDLNQHITYCNSEAVPYFIATDGNKWELYDVFKQVKIQDKKITNWEILNDDPSEIAIKALSISNISSFGKVPFKPLFIETGKERQHGAIKKVPEIASISDTNSLIKSPDQQRKEFKPKYVKIKGENLPVKNVKDVLIQVVEWLIKKGYSKNLKMPVEVGFTGRAKRYILNTKPIHKDGKKFIAEVKIADNFYLETHWSHQAVESLTKQLIKRAGLNENEINIEWELVDK